MQLTKVEQAMLVLLRAGLWMKEPEEDIFPLTKEEWEEVYRLSNEQTITGPVFQGVCMLEEHMPPMDLVEVWLAHVDRIENLNRRMMQVQDDLLRNLQEAGLHPIVMKGLGVAQMYERPLQRTSGDIDLYLANADEFEKATQWARTKGLQPTTMSDGACSFIWQGIEVEVHPALIDIHNPFLKKKLANLIESEDLKGIYPTPLLNLLLLNTHILKHVLGHGIGLRQIADMARACFTLHEDFSEQQYEQACKTLGIERWSAEMNGILCKILGLEAQYLPSQNCSHDYEDYIMQKVLKGGNFGKFGESRGDAYSSKWKKKGRTALSLLRSWKETRGLAPAESFWMMVSLAMGQAHV